MLLIPLVGFGLAFVMKSKAQSITITGLAGSAPTAGPSHATGRLPALGWNHWNAYRCHIDADKVLAAANDIVSLGLKDSGYKYVNIDDCWSIKTRNATTGRIDPDPTKFPNGIDGLANTIHGLGLKIGIYSDAGTKTCGGYPGSLGNETIDAATFTEWGIDYLKYDNCNIPANWTDSATPPGGDWYNSNSGIRYRQMAGALAAQRRHVQLDLCIWGTADVWEWGARVGHSWRISSDVQPNWSSILGIIAINVEHLSSINFFSHNDMDMMEIGNGNLTIEEERTHFAAWAFLKSPILLGTNLGNLTSDQVAIIRNAHFLAFNQDPIIGTPATPFNATIDTPITSPPEYYSGRSTKGMHVFIINTADSAADKTFAFSQIPGLRTRGGSGKFKLYDMWAGKEIDGVFSGNYTVNVAAHDTVAYLIKVI